MSPNHGTILYIIEPALSLVRVHLQGPVTMPQIEEMIDQITVDPAYDLQQDGFIDLREFTGILTPDDLRRMAELVRANPGNAGARRAVVVRDDLQFGLMRMLEGFTFLAPVIYRAFRSEEAAHDWLQERWHPSAKE